MKYAVPLFVLLAAILAIVWFTRPTDEHVGTIEIATSKSPMTSSSVSPPAVTLAPSITATTPPTSTSSSTSTSVSTASAVPSATAPRTFKTPQALVDGQIQALNAGDDAAFRATFLPSVRVTGRELETCKRVVAERKIVPDWAGAEAAMVDGHRVARVSILGRVMTGFHEIDGAMFTDGVWCAPPGEVR